LIQMIESNESDSIGWSRDGNSIVVSDKVRFSKDVLPKFYKTSNFSSFVRQLNFYRFNKIMTEEGKGGNGGETEVEFCHQYFIRDRPDFLPLIKRKTYQDQESAKQIREMKQEMDKLRSYVSDLEGQINGLKSTVDELVRERKTKNERQGPEDQGTDKKRKMSARERVPTSSMIMMSPPKLRRVDSFNEFERLDTTGGGEYELSTFLEDLDFDDETLQYDRGDRVDMDEDNNEHRVKDVLRDLSTPNSSTKSIPLPEGCSEEDAEKVVKLWTYLMPQFQQALLSQVKTSAVTVPESYAPGTMATA